MKDDLEDKIDQLLDELAKERDELRVQLHLLKAEARDEFEELEKKWQHFESTMGRIGESAKESAGDISAAAEQLGEELGQAYKRLKNAIQQ